MLNHLQIHNLAVVKELNLNFKSGLSILTGETGAGKSILIDALGLTLGERADPNLIRAGAHQAEVTAIYDITRYQDVMEWLHAQELDAAEECIIRRTITTDSRSRSYINGRAVPLTQLRQLGLLLLNIHGQHQHQALLKPEHQRQLLDQYASHTKLLAQVKEDYLSWHTLYKEHKALSGHELQTEKLELLQYQLQELIALNLEENELNSLNIEHKTLSHVGQLMHITQAIKNELNHETDEDIPAAIYRLMNQLHTIVNIAPSLKSVHELLSNSIVMIKEASDELENFTNTLNDDPERLNTIDARLTEIHALARKHRVSPENLKLQFENLQREIDILSKRHVRLQSLQAEMDAARLKYDHSARLLSNSRKAAAVDLQQKIMKRMQDLDMKKGKFEIQFHEKVDLIHPQGFDEVECMVTTNPGLPLQALRKIASGGELSRISLAIQVITAEKVTTPTLIFDEVDVGISGKTADIVGSLMRKIAHSTQVLCVTHLSQVAAYSEHHFKVEKIQTNDSTTTSIKELGLSEKINEIARMMGGAKVTPQTLAHASEMLENISV